MASPAFKKLETIQQKIGQLRQEQVLAEQAVAKELLGVLKGLNALELDFEVLVGGLVEMAQKAKASEGKEALLKTGTTFLKRRKPGVARKPETVARD